VSWVKFPTSTGLWLWTEFDRTKKVWSDPEPVRVLSLADSPDRAYLERLGSDHELLIRHDPLKRWTPFSLDGYTLPKSLEVVNELLATFEVVYEKHTVHRITYTLPALTKEEAMARASDQHKKGNVPWRACGSSEALMYAGLKQGDS
jgi:hypothetical protein